MADVNGMLLLQRMAPEALAMMEERYYILRQIRLLQPVGRRMLADVLNSTERIIRREVDFLREQRLLDSNRAGMFVTPDGEMMIEQLHSFWKEVGGIRERETEAERLLQIRRVVVVPGDADENEWVKEDLARQAADELNKLLPGRGIVAVAGGTTVAQMAGVVRLFPQADQITVVPARGALGENVELEANTVAAELASHAGASYRLLYLPDMIEEDVRRNIERDPGIAEVLELIAKTDVLVHGIGVAAEMSRRRGLNENVTHILQEHQAVSEVFGYYFNRAGELVYRMSTVGMQMENVHMLPSVLAIAGGKSKAEAIVSYIRNRANYVLVTDEAAISEVLSLLKESSTHEEEIRYDKDRD
ncbi:central glycolytic genes regulator [Aneurinibacillus soli]|uniref:Central glycolytic genes regulator n=1 Tax=Aneurinibacillus soli TaxID=1500254 RepID=A0A0U5B4M9_9BACL|nr:sugar-binding domain-containing protein [Aneurinibacillus soli]PYE58765.1 central glycolytic genes regulator [Aneurinibacillus soli]BAU26630.1 Central glycolytic genes regulator [Aneurinibacillus soli]